VGYFHTVNRFFQRTPYGHIRRKSRDLFSVFRSADRNTYHLERPNIRNRHGHSGSCSCLPLNILSTFVISYAANSSWFAACCAGSASVEGPQHVSYEQDQQYGAQSYARTAAVTPTAMAVEPSTTTQNQHQDDDQYQHGIFLPYLLPGYYFSSTFNVGETFFRLG
jgi:hypothetical protein